VKTQDSSFVNDDIPDRAPVSRRLGRFFQNHARFDGQFSSNWPIVLQQAQNGRLIGEVLYGGHRASIGNVCNPVSYLQAGKVERLQKEVSSDSPVPVEIH